MYAAEGVGLAAPQIGVQKRLFVWDLGDGPRTIVNPQIVESDGEWVYDEGCLSVPGLSWEIVRPKQVHVIGRDLDGNEVSVEADEIGGSPVPARVGPPRRDAAHRAARRGHPQGCSAHAARAGDRVRLDDRDAAGGRRRRSDFDRPAPAVKRDAAGAAARRLLRHAGSGRAAPAGTASAPVTTSRWWSPVPPSGGAGARRRPPRRWRPQPPIWGWPSPATSADALDVEADLGIVVAYGEHIPDEVLERRRTVNLHFSLLPRWRGRHRWSVPSWPATPRPGSA